MPPLILKRAPIRSNLEHHGVLADGVVAGRVFLLPGASRGAARGCGRVATAATSPARRSATSRRARRRWRHSRNAGGGNKPERKVRWGSPAKTKTPPTKAGFHIAFLSYRLGFGSCVLGAPPCSGTSRGV
jgi:hypothetical protein